MAVINFLEPHQRLGWWWPIMGLLLGMIIGYGKCYIMKKPVVQPVLKPISRHCWIEVWPWLLQADGVSSWSWSPGHIQIKATVSTFSSHQQWLARLHWQHHAWQQWLPGKKGVFYAGEWHRACF